MTFLGIPFFEIKDHTLITHTNYEDACGEEQGISQDIPA